MDRSTQTKKHKLTRTVALLLTLMAILAIGAGFRFFNVNWDEGTYHIHPDERHTAMVVTAIQWPSSVGQYFDTSHSSLNPRNADTVYFYGTLPLFLTKYVGTAIGRTGYDQIHLVGRVLSGLFDLGTVLLLFFLARRLFDWRVGLAASFLLALAVLNIQGSHYFSVDTFLTFFVALTIWFTLDIVEGRGWPAFLGLGVSMGLTLSSKVSVFLLVIVIALGGWFWARREVLKGQSASRAYVRAAGGLILAAFVAIIVFRIAQPYAWAGPNYDGWETVPQPWGERLRVLEILPEPIRAVVMPNPQWVADIVSAGAQQTGEADMPWGRQWTERTPWLYPLENMVLWGLGVPLGIAAWLGVILVIAQLIRGWLRRAPTPADGSLDESQESMIAGKWDLILIPLAWAVLTFLWQGMQYVKSIRYFLPIYPYLAMFAAYLIIAAWDWVKDRRWGAKVAAGALAAVVLVGTLVWAWSFLQIYREPVTRVQATRWMYDNIESAATLHYRTADGDAGQLQLPLPSTHIYLEGQGLLTSFIPPEDLIATELVMNDLTSLDYPSEGLFEIEIRDNQGGEGALARAQIEGTFGGEGGQRHVLDLAHLPLQAGQGYALQTKLVEGPPLNSQGSAIANEHFDDPLPFSMDGRIAFGSGPYRGLDLALYNEDTPEKLEEVLDILDEADYISMSSGRLHTSIPRLPMRYPVTTRYYELLFAEKLGFEKVAEFHSYPRVLGIEFNDDRAEEQFTVYDHPKVLIYGKTNDYDRERVRGLLSEGIDWDKIAHWLNPRDVAEWKRTHEQQQDLMLTEAQRQVQTQGGTWASLFDRSSPANRWPTLAWLILIGIVGLATLPLTLAVFRHLPDRGYILARPVGVLLLAWLSWMLTNLTPLGYTRGTILLALVLIALASLATLLFPGQRRRLLSMWRTQKRLILINEALFLAFFAIVWLIRWGNPDLWHAWKGGEKPMDFAYLNAVIKSTEFPPYDPWFSGGYLNYYYFGQVMVGTLIKAIGIVPAIAYNLAIPTWFAMTATGAFCATYNLIAIKTEAHSEQGASSSLPLRPLFFGLLGALFVALLGNLGEVHLILLKLGEGMIESFQSTIPGLAGLVRAVAGLGGMLFGDRALPIRLDEWYWNASRVIPAGPYEAVITEFPFFTFLYGDLHAHLIAMPLTFVSLSAALALVGKSKDRGTPESSKWNAILARLALLFLWALTIGAMRTTNTWDVPPHLLVVLGSLVIAEYGRRGQLSWRLAGSVAWQFGLVFLLSWSILYWPFWTNYASFYTSVAEWTGTRTMLWAYLVMFGLFLFAILSYLLARTVGDSRQDPLLRRVELTLRYRTRRRRLREAAKIVGIRGLPISTLFWIGLGLLILIELLLVVPGLFSFTQPNPEAVMTDAYAYRGLAVFALGLPMALLGLLLLLRPSLLPAERLWAYLVLLGLAMSLGVEVIVLQGDIGRMNTVFKFYLQVWLIWGVAAAAALAWMIPRLWRWQQGRGLWLGVLAGLLFFAALYPPLAIAARVDDRFDTRVGPSLDGWAYMETAQYLDPNGPRYDLKWDMEAIEWMLDNVVGSPVILEGHTPEYRWGARYSINTGLPAVLGWNWHQRQQRGTAGDREVWDRASDVALIYNSPSPEITESLLRDYDVRYIIVGPLERAYYVPAGLDNFEQMAREGKIEPVFGNAEVTIYKVAW